MKGSLILMALVIASLLSRMHNTDSKQQASKLTIDGSADMSVTEDVENFRHNASSPANAFDVYEKRIRISNTMAIEGKRESQSVTRTDLPNAEQGEYERVILTPGEGKLGTIKETDAFYSKALKKLVTLSAEHEIQLVDGTWDDYRNGQDVKFIASPRGIEQVKKNLTEQTKMVFAEMSKSAVTQQLEAKNVKNVSFNGDVQEAQISNDPVTASVNTIKVYDTGLTRIVFKFHGEGTKVTQ